MSRLADRFLDTAITSLLSWRSRPDAVRRALAPRWYPVAEPPTRERVRAAAVQMRLELCDDARAFANQYYRLTRESVLRGAQLVVFPEYAWLPLLGLLPAVRSLAERGLTLQQSVGELGGGGLTLEGVFRTIAPAVARVMAATASELAARFNIYLMPGTAVATDCEGHIFNVAYLYGPDGRLIGQTAKLHPDRKEVGWLTCGQALEVWRLPFGNVAAPVCMDFSFWETTRIAALRGAEILLDMKADDAGDEPYLAARGVLTRVQEVPAYGIGSYCVTDLFSLHFRGPSFIAGPIGLVQPGAALLARADSADREEIVVADLDLARLRDERDAHPLEYNRALYAKYLPRLYESRGRQGNAETGRGGDGGHRDAETRRIAEKRE